MEASQNRALADSLLESRQRSFMAQLRHQLYPTPLIVDRGFMEYLWDVEGRKYLDFFSGILVTNCGHCNPEINQAIKDQMDRLDHVSSFFLSESMVRLTDRLREITPAGLERVFVVGTGSEAVDGAVVLARHFTGRQDVVSLYLAYHGRTLLAMALCGFTGYKAAGPLVPGLIFGPNAYCYRCPMGLEHPKCDLACADGVERAIRAAATGPIAAIIAEPIQGVGGVIVSPPAYLARLREIATRYGGLLIIDEVQSGFGRAGSMFLIDQYGVTPDILVLAKGMGNGQPIAAYVAREDVGESLKSPTFSTYGGNPVTSAGALATLAYIEKHDLAANAAKVGKDMVARLRKMSEKRRLIGDVRGLGLMLGVELVRDRKTKEPASAEAMKVLEEARRRGLVLGKSGPANNVLRIGPPLTITTEQAEEGLGILDEALGAVEDQA